MFFVSDGGTSLPSDDPASDTEVAVLSEPKGWHATSAHNNERYGANGIYSHTGLHFPNTFRDEAAKISTLTARSAEEKSDL